MNETWNPVLGFPNYKASNLGNIRHKRAKKNLKPIFEEARRYTRVDLRKSGIRYSKTISNIVWEAFNGEKPTGYDIHHKDFKPLNNNLENLECISRKEHRQRHKNKSRKKLIRYNREQINYLLSSNKSITQIERILGRRIKSKKDLKSRKYVKERAMQGI